MTDFFEADHEEQAQRMQQDTSKTETPDLIAAFEGSQVEIEFLATYSPPGSKMFKSALLATFEYRTKPEMSYIQEGYQRGPLHVGQVAGAVPATPWGERRCPPKRSS